MNQISLVGRMTRDPELHVTKSGRHFTYITLAINRNYRNTVTGLYETDFIPCKLWGKMAVNVVNHCEKGFLVGIVGRLESRSKNDLKARNQILEVVADRVIFLARPHHNAQEEPPLVEIENDDLGHLDEDIEEKEES